MIQRLLRAGFQRAFLLLFIVGIVLGPSTPGPVEAAGNSIAYVYSGNQTAADDFKNHLTPAYTVTQIPLSLVQSSDLSKYDLVIIADDTGSLGDWGTPADSVAQVAKISSAGVPILGVGEGGYSYFGKVSAYIGWPHGWHGPQDSAVSESGSTIISATPGTLVKLYTQAVNSVGIFVPKNTTPGDVTIHGREPDVDPLHADQVNQGCQFLWGNSGSPTGMTPAGVTAFDDYVKLAISATCQQPPAEVPLPQGCITLTKTSEDSNQLGDARPGDSILYTLTYTKDDKSCTNVNFSTINLVDKIPADTTYVPNSASDGISPDIDGNLTWNLSSSGSTTKTFKVIVAESQCFNQRTVNNHASVLASGYTAVTSLTVSNPVECPVIALPNNSTFYAEDELQVNPYPLIAGRPSQVSVRLINTNTLLSQAVTVAFQSAPLGIGQTYTTFDTQTATIPPSSTLLLDSTYTPLASGQESFQVTITAGVQVTFTQSNLDVSENFVPGTPDSLVVPVRNNTGSATAISLVVVNTCPGWSASVNPTTTAVLPNGGSEDVTLEVTPPVGIDLGTGCHIDLQAWAGTTLIGGVRKLDVPPVHLPSHVTPPWLEPEISVSPNPPVLGSPGSLCVELTNPLGVSKTVTVDFAEADFGAGIGFTPVGTETFTLPPNSTNRYCTAWTPSLSGTLHRCLMVTLKQDGFLDMRSQRNLDVVRDVPAGLGSFRRDFHLGNPDGIAHKLAFTFNTVGLSPAWVPEIVTPLGDPAPTTIAADTILDLVLRFTPPTGSPASSLAQTGVSNYWFGSATYVEVGVQLDGRDSSGFTVQLVNPHVFLPAIRH